MLLAANSGDEARLWTAHRLDNPNEPLAMLVLYALALDSSRMESYARDRSSFWRSFFLSEPSQVLNFLVDEKTLGIENVRRDQYGNAVEATDAFYREVGRIEARDIVAIVAQYICRGSTCGGPEKAMHLIGDWPRVDPGFFEEIALKEGVSPALRIEAMRRTCFSDEEAQLQFIHKAWQAATTEEIQLAVLKEFTTLRGSPDFDHVVLDRLTLYGSHARSERVLDAILEELGGLKTSRAIDLLGGTATQADSTNLRKRAILLLGGPEAEDRDELSAVRYSWLKRCYETSDSELRKTTVVALRHLRDNCDPDLRARIDSEVAETSQHP